MTKRRMHQIYSAIENEGRVLSTREIYEMTKIPRGTILACMARAVRARYVTQVGTTTVVGGHSNLYDLGPEKPPIPKPAANGPRRETFEDFMRPWWTITGYKEPR